jgi:hypothetical protein
MVFFGFTLERLQPAWQPVLILKNALWGSHDPVQLFEIQPV